MHRLVRSMMSLFFFNDTATTEIYTLSLHDALPICSPQGGEGKRAHPRCDCAGCDGDHPPSRGRRGRRDARKRRSEEHTSELQSLAYLVCRLLLEKKKTRRHFP